MCRTQKKGSEEAKKITQLFDNHPKVSLAKKNTFTKNNVLLDITPTTIALLQNMHKKHRYNIRYAQRKGVTVRQGTTKKDFELFYKLHRDTAIRQNFLVHPKSYYKKVFDTLVKYNMVFLMIAEYKNELLSSWMLFKSGDTLYYPYGGSSNTHKNLQASTLLGWESIKHGKNLGCTTFDMWGACKDINDKNDPEWGFTNFKLRYGGEYIEYMNSYDLILNKSIYEFFSFTYPKALKILRMFHALR